MNDWKRKIDLYEQELDKLIEREGITNANLPIHESLARICKYLETVDAMVNAGEEPMEYRYSGGYSGARRRDSMGRYSGDHEGGYSGDDYSGDSYSRYSGARNRDTMPGYSGANRRGGYSGDDEGMRHVRTQLRSLMGRAQNEEENEAIRKVMNMLDK